MLAAFRAFITRQGPSHSIDHVQQAAGTQKRAASASEESRSTKKQKVLQSQTPSRQLPAPRVNLGKLKPVHREALERHAQVVQSAGDALQQMQTLGQSLGEEPLDSRNAAFSDERLQFDLRVQAYEPQLLGHWTGNTRLIKIVGSRLIQQVCDLITNGASGLLSSYGGPGVLRPLCHSQPSLCSMFHVVGPTGSSKPTAVAGAAAALMYMCEEQAPGRAHVLAFLDMPALLWEADGGSTPDCDYAQQVLHLAYATQQPWPGQAAALEAIDRLSSLTQVIAFVKQQALKGHVHYVVADNTHLLDADATLYPADMRVKVRAFLEQLSRFAVVCCCGSATSQLAALPRHKRHAVLLDDIFRGFSQEQLKTFGSHPSLPQVHQADRRMMEDATGCLPWLLTIFAQKLRAASGAATLAAAERQSAAGSSDAASSPDMDHVNAPCDAMATLFKEAFTSFLGSVDVCSHLSYLREWLQAGLQPKPDRPLLEDKIATDLVAYVSGGKVLPRKHGIADYLQNDHDGHASCVFGLARDMVAIALLKANKYTSSVHDYWSALVTKELSEPSPNIEMVCWRMEMVSEAFGGSEAKLLWANKAHQLMTHPSSAAGRPHLPPMPVERRTGRRPLGQHPQRTGRKRAMAGT